MRLHTLAVGSAVTVLALSGLAASTASATPATGSVTTHPVTPPTALWPVRSRRRRTEIKLKINDDATVRNFTLTYGPGGQPRAGTSIRASCSLWSSPGR